MRQLRCSTLDIETTGLSQEKGHRIIEVAVGSLTLQFDDENNYLSHEIDSEVWNQRINPCRAIDPDAEAVHGISLHELKDEPLWEEVAGAVSARIGDSDLAIAHNVEFDMPFVALELMRVEEKVPDLQTYCTLENGRGSTGLGSVPSLQRLCWSLGVTYNPEDAHAADYDVNCTMLAFVKGVQSGAFDLASILDAMYAPELLEEAV